MYFVNDTFFRSSRVCCFDVSASAFEGSNGPRSLTSVSGEIPGFAATQMASYWFFRSKSLCASGMVNTAKVALPSDSWSP
jgi:hypothetical protein